MKLTDGGLYFENDSCYTTSTSVKVGEFYLGTSNPSGGTYFRAVQLNDPASTYNQENCALSLPVAASAYSSPSYYRSGVTLNNGSVSVKAYKGGYRLA